MKNKPVLNSEDFKLTDLFDLEEIQKLQDAFSSATGVASIITEPNGKPITNPSGFCDLCMKIIRKSKKGLEYCQFSDSVIGQPSEGPRIQPCLSGGLVDAGASIVVKDKHIGNWLIGQVIVDDDVDIEELVAYADVIDVNRELYKNELLKVKRLPKEQFEAICNFLYINAQYLSEYAMQTILLSQELVRKNLTELEIRQMISERTKQLEEMNCELEEANALLEEEVSHRQNVEKEINELNNSLEHLVKERTAQLDSINNELKQMNIRLEKYRILAENANDIMLFIRKDGKIIEANNRALKTYGYTQDELLSMTVFDLRRIKTNKLKVLEQMNKADEGGIVFETIHYRKDGTSFYAEVSSQGTYLGNSRVLLSIVRDISERKAAEQEIIKAKEEAEAANIAKSQFLANMSHEIRTPMNGILGFLQILELSELNDDQKDCIDTIKYSAEVLTSIINDILDLSKIEAGKVELETIHFDLYKTIEGSITPFILLANKKGVQFSYHISSQVPRFVIGDSTKFRQLIINIINNAVKFTDKGVIHVDIEALNHTDSVITLMIKVTDTGIGISINDLDKVFQPFSQADASLTRKFGGTGLGLAISKRIANLMGGDIQVKSAIGAGSTFTVSVNMNRVDEPYGIETVTNQPLNQHKVQIKILLAEDNEINVKLFKKMLKLRGLNCDVVDNGEQAIKAHIEGNYDIIFMDCQMPVVDGYEATKRIRQLEAGSKHTNIVAITAYAMKGDEEKCYEAGMDAYINKPIDINKVYQLIESFSIKV